MFIQCAGHGLIKPQFVLFNLSDANLKVCLFYHTYRNAGHCICYYLQKNMHFPVLPIESRQRPEVIGHAAAIRRLLVPELSFSERVVPCP